MTSPTTVVTAGPAVPPAGSPTIGADPDGVLAAAGALTEIATTCDRLARPEGREAGVWEPLSTAALLATDAAWTLQIAAVAAGAVDPDRARGLTAAARAVGLAYPAMSDVGRDEPARHARRAARSIARAVRDALPAGRLADVAEHLGAAARHLEGLDQALAVREHPTGRDTGVEDVRHYEVIGPRAADLGAIADRHRNAVDAGPAGSASRRGAGAVEPAGPAEEVAADG